MLWFSLALVVPMGIFAWFCSPYLLAESLRELGVPYLRILLPSVPISLAAFGALNAFFTGRGETRFVSVVSILCNVLNIALDIPFVLGWGPIPAMGIRGAAWATVISQCVALALFARYFFARRYAEKFQTRRRRFDGKIFMRCLRIGSPNALSALINFVFWSWILQVMVRFVPMENFRAFGISQSFFHTMLFFVEGVSLAVSTIDANAYGAHDWDMVARNTRSWIKLSVLVTAVSYAVVVAYPRPLLALFIHGPSDGTFRSTLAAMRFWTWLALAIASIDFNLRQALTAFGDTVFTMAVGLIGYALCAIVPGYFAIKITGDATYFLICETVSQSAIAVAYSLRYRRWITRRPAPSRPPAIGPMD
jgi:putative MATE family efflux protein